MFLSRLAKPVSFLFAVVIFVTTGLQTGRGEDYFSAVPVSQAVTASPETISAGYSHTCKLLKNGYVSCWGFNDSGQINPPLGVFTQISSGTYHTCGIMSDGTPVCWGLELLPPPGIFTQISSGTYHACGIRSDGTVACWGYNLDGQVIPGGVFMQVSAGEQHTCGLRNNGFVECWGDISWGQASPPAEIFTQINSGTMNTCGLKDDGSIACWGRNDYGQSSPPDGKFLQVSVGDIHACGIHTDGTLRCWGSNDFGQATPPSGMFSEISAGGAHTCARRVNGFIACWGLNVYGQATIQNFSDVPPSYWVWSQIEILAANGITAGCDAERFCPLAQVKRAETAIFLLRAKYGSAYVPPPVGDSTGFADVPVSYWAAAWIKQFAIEGITDGCGSGNFCPARAITRAEMAVFILRTKYGADYTPPDVGGVTGFSDVPVSYWAASWIKQLAAENITSGCGAGKFCPTSPVSRDQMAVFLVRAFGLK